MSFFDDLTASREGMLSLGFWALQVHRFGPYRFRFKSKLVRWPIALLHLPLHKFSEMFFGKISFPFSIDFWIKSDRKSIVL